MFANTNQFDFNEEYYSNDLGSLYPAITDLSSRNMAGMGSYSYNQRSIFDPLAINPQATSTPANVRSQLVSWGPITHLSQGSEMSFQTCSSGPFSDRELDHSLFSAQPRTESYSTQAQSNHGNNPNLQVPDTYQSAQQMNTRQDHMLLHSHQDRTLAPTNETQSKITTDSGICMSNSQQEQINADRLQAHSSAKNVTNGQNDGISVVEAQLQQQLKEIQTTLQHISLVKQKQQQSTSPNQSHSSTRQTRVQMCEQQPTSRLLMPAKQTPVECSSTPISGERQYHDPTIRRPVGLPSQSQMTLANATGFNINQPQYTQPGVMPLGTTSTHVQSSSPETMRQSFVDPYPQLQTIPAQQLQPSHVIHQQMQAPYNKAGVPTSVLAPYNMAEVQTSALAPHNMITVPATVGQPFATMNINGNQVKQMPNSEQPYVMPTNNTMFAASSQDNASQRRMPYKKEIHPDNFDGSNKTEWSDYIIHFEQVASWNEWTDAQKAKMLSIHLRGEAQKLLTDLTMAQLSNYDTMKQIITDRYAPKEKDVAYRCQLRYRKREKGESVSDYGHHLSRLARKAYPNLTLSQLEMYVIDQFITGLGNYELQKHVQFGHPKSMNAAIGLATEYEALDGSVDRVRKPRVSSEQIAPIVSNENDVHQSITLDQIDKLLDRKLNTLAREGTCRNKSPNPEPTHTSKMATEHKESSTSEPKSEETKQAKFCNYCKRRNHTIEECRTRQYKERREAEKQTAQPKSNTAYVITPQDSHITTPDIVITPVHDPEPQQVPGTETTENPIKQDNTVNESIHEHLLNPVEMKADIAATSCLYIVSEMFDTNVKLLVDTGSPYSILSQKHFEKLQQEHDIKLYSHPIKLTAAGGSKLDISGKVTINFRTMGITYEQDFIVARIQGIVGILGMDFLTKYDGSIKVRKQTLKTSKGKLKLNKQPSTIETFNYQIQYRPGRQHQNADTLSRKPNRKCPNTSCPDCYPSSVNVGQDDNGEADSLMLVTATNKIEECTSYQSPATSPSLAPGPAVLQQTDRETAKVADSTRGRPPTYKSPIGPLVRETRTELSDRRDSTANWLPTWSPSELSKMQSDDSSLSVIIERRLCNEKPTLAEIDQTNYIAKALWYQWNELKVVDGVLYRKWLDKRGNCIRHFSLLNVNFAGACGYAFLCDGRRLVRAYLIRRRGAIWRITWSKIAIAQRR